MSTPGAAGESGTRGTSGEGGVAGTTQIGLGGEREAKDTESVFYGYASPEPSKWEMKPASSPWRKSLRRDLNA
jgi:hypothetical protein